MYHGLYSFQCGLAYYIYTIESQAYFLFIVSIINAHSTKYYAQQSNARALKCLSYSTTTNYQNICHLHLFILFRPRIVSTLLRLFTSVPKVL